LLARSEELGETRRRLEACLAETKKQASVLLGPDATVGSAAGPSSDSGSRQGTEGGEHFLQSILDAYARASAPKPTERGVDLGPGAGTMVVHER